MYARRYFVDAEPPDPLAVEALAFIRTLYAVERAIKVERGKLARRSPVSTSCGGDGRGPGRSSLAAWLDVQSRPATPKSQFGQAVTFITRRPGNGRTRTDGRDRLQFGRVVHHAETAVHFYCFQAQQIRIDSDRFDSQ